MPISYNEPITFGASGTAASLNCTGIDLSEDGYQSWTNAPVAELEIQLPIARQEVLLQVNASPFLIPEIIVSQSVFIFMGGFFVGFSPFVVPAVREFSIARNLISGRSMRLSLVIPTAKSPKSLNISADLRELGICLHSLVFKSE